MLATTFKHNEIIYIQGIGYGTLDCPKSKFFSSQDLALNQKKSSIYFDPDLFNSDGSDSNKSKKKQKSLQKKQETQQNAIKEKSIIEEKSTENVEEETKIQVKEPVQERINIVTAKLYGTETFVYVQDKLIRKYIVVPVKVLFTRGIGTFNIKIEIYKTIQSLQKAIFEQLGLRYSNYSKIKLFITSPWLTQLKVTTKTVAEYRISENSSLAMTADHNFCFQGISEALSDNFLLINNNMTLIVKQRPKPKPVPQKIETAVIVQKQNEDKNKVKVNQLQKNKSSQNKQNTIQKQHKLGEQKKSQAEPPKQNNSTQIEPINQLQTQAQKQIQQQNNKICEQAQNQMVENPSKQTQSPKQSQSLKEQDKNKQLKQIKQIQIPFFNYFYGNIYIQSGRKYWQIKIEKGPHKKEQLQIGVANQKYLYVFQPLLGKKMKFPKHKNSQNFVGQNSNQEKIQIQSYGTIFKQGENIGVLVQFRKECTSRLSFYRNNVGFGTCFSEIIGEIRPVFGVGEGAQISLQTKLDYPIDSYRRRK